MPIIYKKNAVVNKNARIINRPKATTSAPLVGINVDETPTTSTTTPYKIVTYAYMASSRIPGGAPTMYYVWKETQLSSPPNLTNYVYISNATCFSSQLVRESNLFVYDGNFNTQLYYPAYNLPLRSYPNPYCTLNATIDNVYLPKNLTVINMGLEYGTRYCSRTY